MPQSVGGRPLCMMSCLNQVARRAMGGGVSGLEELTIRAPIVLSTDGRGALGRMAGALVHLRTMCVPAPYAPTAILRMHLKVEGVQRGLLWSPKMMRRPRGRLSPC